MVKKILITVGGTGGHVYPAIALGKQLSEGAQPIELLYVGGNLSANPYFERESFPHQSISCGTYKKKTPWEFVKKSSQIIWGIKQSYEILKKYQPDLVVGFGSYYTLPVLLAAKMRGVPFILHEANSIPGKVNRFLSKYAKKVGILFPSTAALLQGNTYEVGLPLRPGYQKGLSSRLQAIEYFDLDPSLFTVLVFGGSQGAVNLNHLVSKAFINHLSQSKDKWQVIHLAGDATLAQLLRADYQKAGIRACVKPFESRMDLAWHADMYIARAGAGTIAEVMEFEVPGLLVPYPFATDNHQDKNADFLAETVKGALKFNEGDLTPLLLAQEIEKFTKEKCIRMSQSIKDYKLKYRSKDFSHLIREELAQNDPH